METILFKSFLVHNLFVTITPIIFEGLVGYKIPGLHFLELCGLGYEVSLSKSYAIFFPCKRFGLLLGCPKDFSLRNQY